LKIKLLSYGFVLLILAGSLYWLYKPFSNKVAVHIDLKPGYSKKLSSFYSTHGIPSQYYKNIVLVDFEDIFKTEEFSKDFIYLVDGDKGDTAYVDKKIDYEKLDYFLKNYGSEHFKMYLENLERVMKAKSRLQLSEMENEKSQNIE
jgi:hypothetical protein